MRKELWATAISLCLSACAADGPAFKGASLPQGDGPTVIVYRPSEFVGSLAAYDVNINSRVACALHNHSYFVTDSYKGGISISATRFATPGTSVISIDRPKKKNYYIRMENNDGKTLAAGGAGLIGIFVAEGVSSTPGPFVFTLVEENEAINELQGLKRDCL